MNCPICAGTMRPCFNAVVLQKHVANYEVCKTCGYLAANDPHWIDEAYSSAIVAADTGLVTRNVSIAFKVACILYWMLGERGQGRYLDGAGGYGILTRLMRDLGFDFYWSDKYCSNLLARGFEYTDQHGPCRAVTAMEVMEHLIDPVAFVDEMLKRTGAKVFVFTTELYEGSPPNPEEWWYYAFPAGQHIGFFTRKTCEFIGKRLGLHFTSANGIHVLSRAPLSERKLKWVTSPLVSLMGTIWIRRRLGSRTMSDHLQLMGKAGL